MASNYPSEDETIYDSSDSDVWEPNGQSSDNDSDTETDPAPVIAGHAGGVRGYEDEDLGPDSALPNFKPQRTVGVHLPEDILTRSINRKYLTPLDFFNLYFTTDILLWICKFTNRNAEIIGPQKKSLWEGWREIDVAGLRRFIGLIMFMGVVKVPSVEKYWSTKSLYHGLWARGFMTKLRFKQIMCFLKLYNPDIRVNPENKIHKVELLYAYIKCKCKKLYQPGQNVSIDERMVRNKGRYSFRQYIRDKPTKWGMKFWILADSKTAYTYDYNLYLGKTATPPSKFGLAYDVVMKLVSSLVNQGYRLYFDNFYTGVELLKELVAKGIRACGTVRTNRRGFPATLRNVKQFEKGSRRGDMRWVRDGDILTVQWRDNKTVTVMSSIHKASAHGTATRRSKENGVFREAIVRQPAIIKDYNEHMGGVDKSDQLINKYNSLRKTHKWWKTVFFHLIDIARVNSYILFEDFRKKHKDIKELKRNARYNQLDFTEELIRQLGAIDSDKNIPQAQKPKKFFTHSVIPKMSGTRGNCKLCYETEKIERKTFVICEECNLHLCFNSTRNCLVKYHESA